MPITKVMSNASGRGGRSSRATIFYPVSGPGHAPGTERYLSFGGVGFVGSSPEAAEAAFAQTRAQFRKQLQVEAYHVVVSFNLDEIDPDDPEDVRKVEQFADEYVREAWPGRKVWWVLQADGEGTGIPGETASGLARDGRRMQVHIAVDNLHAETGRACREADMRWTRLAPVTDRVAERCGIPVPEYMPEPEIPGWKHSSRQMRATAARGRSSYLADVSAEIRLASADAVERLVAGPAIASVDDEQVLATLADELEARGIRAEFVAPRVARSTRTKGRGKERQEVEVATQRRGRALYSWTDNEGVEREGVSSSTLGKAAGRQGRLDEIREQVAQRQAELQAQQVAERLHQEEEVRAEADLVARLRQGIEEHRARTERPRRERPVLSLEGNEPVHSADGPHEPREHVGEADRRVEPAEMDPEEVAAVDDPQEADSVAPPTRTRLAPSQRAYRLEVARGWVVDEDAQPDEDPQPE